jgi:hypothetical protein
MATSAIIPSENLDINRVMIGEIRSNKAGGKTVPIKYNGQPLQVRIPRIFYPAGVVVREDEKTGQRNYSMLASLKGCVGTLLHEVQERLTFRAQMYIRDEIQA